SGQVSYGIIKQTPRSEFSFTHASCRMKNRYTASFTALLTICGTFWAQAAAGITDTKPGYAPFKKCWEYNLTDSNGGSLVSSNGTIYFAESEGRIRALNAKTSNVDWVSELGGTIAATRVVPKLGLAVVTRKPEAAGSGMLRLLNLETGLVKYSEPVEASEVVYL